MRMSRSRRDDRDARLEVVKDTGHLPQIEQPDATFALIDAYAEIQT